MCDSSIRDNNHIVRRNFLQIQLNARSPRTFSIVDRGLD